jgi:predicted component of type VI protein secretion system
VWFNKILLLIALLCLILSGCLTGDSSKNDEDLSTRIFVKVVEIAALNPTAYRFYQRKPNWVQNVKLIKVPAIKILDA